MASKPQHRRRFLMDAAANGWKWGAGILDNFSRLGLFAVIYGIPAVGFAWRYRTPAGLAIGLILFAFLAFFEGAFQLWKKSEQGLALFASETVSVMHADELRESVKRAVRAVVDDEPIVYGDPNVSRLREAFRAHFPPCAELIDSYEASRALRDTAEAEFKGRLVRELAARGFDDDPYQEDYLWHALWTNLRDTARGNPHALFRVEWVHGNESRNWDVAVKGGDFNQPVAVHVVGEDAYARVVGALDQLQADAPGWQESTILRDAEDARVAAVTACVDPMIQASHPEMYRRSDSCPRCRVG